MAAIVRQHGKTCLVVVDPWEVRAVLTAGPRDTSRLRRLLVGEDPELIAALGRRPSWLSQRWPVELVATKPPRVRLPFPELRRFAGTAVQAVVETAVALAFQALFRHFAHDQPVPKK